MIAIPAIDLRDGACVQLVGGSYDDERVRLDDPVAVAACWREAGFERLHVVDLDAATGRGNNTRMVQLILEATGEGVQVGGGVRTARDIDDLVEAGASSVVLGTRAVQESDWLDAEARRNPGRVILAADVSGEDVVVSGWAERSGLTVDELLGRSRDLPLAGVLITSVDREGRLEGPDTDLYVRLRDQVAFPLIASGGIGSMQDLSRLRDAGVDAAVIGMALYAGQLQPARVAEEFGS